MKERVNYVICQFNNNHFYIIDEFNFFHDVDIKENNDLFMMMKDYKKISPELINIIITKIENKENGTIKYYSADLKCFIQINILFLNPNKVIIYEKPFLHNYDKLLNEVLNASNYLLNNDKYSSSIKKSFEIIGKAFSLDIINLYIFNNIIKWHNNNINNIISDCIQSNTKLL